MLFSPALHGPTGFWDEIIFVVGFIVSVLIFIGLALGDRKREPKEDARHEDDDR
jgi:hypothetical protein